MELLYNIDFEIASLVFLTALFLYTYSLYSRSRAVNRSFFIALVGCWLTTAADILGAVTISYCKHIPPAVTMLVNTAYFVLAAATCVLFSVYFLLSLEINLKKDKVFLVQLGILGAYALFLFINLFTGWVYSIPLRVEFVKGPLYPMVYIMPLYFMAWAAFCMFRCFKNYSKKQQILMVIFMVVSFSGVLIQLLWAKNVLLETFTSGIGMMMMLFILESADYKEMRLQAEKLAQENADLRAVDEATNVFLVNLSQDLRRPVNGLLNMDEMIIREKTTPEVRQCAVNIHSAGEKMLNTVNDLLDYTKLASGEMKIVEAEYELKDVLAECYSFLSNKAAERRLRVNFYNDPGVPARLYGDYGRIRQIVMNLLSNAVKYTESGSVSLSVRWREGQDKRCWLQISVKDTGLGVSKENIDLLHRAMERADLTKNRSIEGTGLGLAITYGLLKLMGGDMFVTSEIGKGSEFVVEIPQQITGEEPLGDFSSDFANGAIQVGRRKFEAPEAMFLVVDDVQMNLDIIRGLLRHTKVQLEFALSGSQAIEMVKTKKYDIIFLDHMMPMMDGVETLRRMRRMEHKNYNTPVIALTANAVIGARETYLREGFADYLAKPVKSEVLENMIFKFLSKKKIKTEELPNETEEVSTVETSQEDILRYKAEFSGLDEVSLENMLAAAGSEEDTNIPAEENPEVVSNQTPDTQEQVPLEAKDLQPPTEDYETQSMGLLGKLSFLDTQTGLMYCGEDEDFYKEMLEEFVTGSLVDVIQTAFDAEDWSTYQINVHAVKGMALTIGAIHCHESAKAIDAANKAEDREFPKAHHADFMAEYKELLGKIQDALA